LPVSKGLIVRYIVSLTLLILSVLINTFISLACGIITFQCIRLYSDTMAFYIGVIMAIIIYSYLYVMNRLIFFNKRFIYE